MSLSAKLILVSLSFASCAVELHNYEQMPPVQLHDDYLGCLKNFGKAAVYCSGKSYVKPDENSTVWRTIQEYSANSFHHYRHESLVRGLCSDRCEALLRTRDAPFVPSFVGDPSIYFSKLKYSQRKQDQERYGELINRCVNLEMAEYGLEAYTEIDYCTSAESQAEPADWLDWFCIVLCLAIGAWTFLGTYYDLSLKSQQDHPDYYQKTPVNASRLLLAFSLPRNFVSLITVSRRAVNLNNNDVPLVDDFDFFEALRILTMIVNMHVHIWATLASLPSANPDAYERETYEFSFKFSCGATFTNQVYLTLGGFLLTRSAVRDLKRGRVFQFRDLFEDLKKRYWRLTPLYAFMILFEATLVRFVYDGPFWQNYWMEDYGNCRQNWWANLLYIHNVFDPKYQCILPTWYLSTDMQLYIMRFLILYVISHFPKFKVHIMGSMAALSYIIPGLIGYLNDFDPVYMGTMEGTRFFYRHDPQYAAHHIPPHTNFGSYITGMITAFLYYEISERKIDLRQSRLFQVPWNLVRPLFILLLFSSTICTHLPFARPTLWTALATALHKNLWGICLAVTILGYNARMGGHMKSLLDSSLWQVFGKTNYCFYLTHMTVFKMMVGNFHHPYYFQFSNLVFSVFFLIVFGYFTGSVAHILIELPAANLQKIWNTRHKREEPKKVE